MTTTADDRRNAPRSLDRLNVLMGVQTRDVRPDHVVLAQDVGSRFHDHRGHTILGSVGVLVDACPGGALGTAVPEDTAMVLSQVSATLAAPMPGSGLVVATGDTVHLDLEAGMGLASGTLQDETGTTVAVLQSRGVVVTRPRAHADAVFGGERLPVPESEPAAAEDELTGRSGLAIVDDIAAERIARGPLAGLLDIRLAQVERGSLTATFAPRDWMSNPFGSIQGGVLISAADLVNGLVTQTLTAPGQRYRILDLRIDFVRSPASDGPAVRAEAEVVRAGRRLALIESRLIDDAGQVLALTSASAQLL